MVIGLFPTANDAAICLNNLAEADFATQDISLVMKTRRDVEAIADVSGPLTGLPVPSLELSLTALGLPRKDTQTYLEGILKGGVFIAVHGGSADAAAAEMLKDNGGQAVQILKDRSQGCN